LEDNAAPAIPEVSLPGALDLSSLSHSPAHSPDDARVSGSAPAGLSTSAPAHAWARRSLARAARALWESVLIVAAVAVVWYLQQWISAFLLLVALIGLGAWRGADTLFRPATLADRVLLAITTAAAWIVLVAELLSAGRLLGQPAGWAAVLHWPSPASGCRRGVHHRPDSRGRGYPLTRSAG
jgi:hypothetical protein